MKDTYTLEEIEAAVLPDNGDWNTIKARLTRPATEFAEGEVVYCVKGNYYQRSVLRDPHHPYRVRKLTTQESGAQELIDALLYAANSLKSTWQAVQAERVFDAIDKWRKDRGE